jgi:hypothetical protein
MEVPNWEFEKPIPKFQKFSRGVVEIEAEEKGAPPGCGDGRPAKEIP